MAAKSEDLLKACFKNVNIFKELNDENIYCL